jgi:choline dehydrogenase-like flavoprotein
MFGGSSTRWGGQILPFTPDIFDPPEGLPSEKWPINGESLSPYYPEVENILGVNSHPYSGELAETLRGKSLWASNDIDIRFSKWAPFKKRNLAQTVGVEAIAHPKITIFTHANAAELVASRSNHDRISSVTVLSYARQKFSFSANYFVICAGTVESSRLLLCSPDIPNPHDQIGRYFHDHVAFIAAHFVPPGRNRAIELLGPFYIDGTTHTCKFEASLSLRSRENMLPSVGYILIDEPEDSGATALRNMLRSVQMGRMKEGIGTNMAPMLRGGRDIARLALYSRFRNRRAVSKEAVLHLTIDAEQSPDPKNRIRISDSKRDALGMHTAIIEWRVNEPEILSAARYSQILRKYLERANIDPRDWSTSVLNDTMPTMSDTNHAMGGLRMGNDASRSVVNCDLMVHGMDNLYVASCAVFPSGGSSNPTFTMMALTLRLAEHLACQIAKQENLKYSLVD